MAVSESDETPTFLKDRPNSTKEPPGPLIFIPVHQAQRLMEGYSSNSRRSSSAPSGQPLGGATPTLDERSTLPVSLRIAVVRAKVFGERDF